jgi:hypothetical protein
MKLFRPVGLQELGLIWDARMRQFPPRLPHQAVFYPVTTLDYAKQIARDWNTRDENSAFAGYVIQFTVSDSYIERFEPHVVGSSSHVEFWIPASELSAFNASIQGLISLDDAFFGKDFKGSIPEKFGLTGKDVVTQFIIMHKSWGYSRMDFTLEVSVNRKTFYVNFLFWAQFDFTSFGIDREQRDATIKHLREAWEFYPTDVPLPSL